MSDQKSFSMKNATISPVDRAITHNLTGQYTYTITGWIILVDGDILRPKGSPTPPYWKTEKAARKALDRHIRSTGVASSYTYAVEGTFRWSHTEEEKAKIYQEIMESPRIEVKYVKDHEIKVPIRH